MAALFKFSSTEPLCKAISLNIQYVHPDKNITHPLNQAQGYKTFSMLNSTEHEILNVHKYEYIIFLNSGKPRMLFFLLINVKMPTIVGMLIFISRKHFMLS